MSPNLRLGQRRKDPSGAHVSVYLAAGDVAGLEPAARCLQTREGKTLTALFGVVYTEISGISALSNVPKLRKRTGRSSPVAFIDVRCGNDVRYAGQRETQIDNAKYDRSQARGPRVLHPNPTGN